MQKSYLISVYTAVWPGGASSRSGKCCWTMVEENLKILFTREKEYYVQIKRYINFKKIKLIT